MGDVELGRYCAKLSSILRTCSGVFPSAKTASGNPAMMDREWSRLAKSLSICELLTRLAPPCSPKISRASVGAMVPFLTFSRTSIKEANDRDDRPEGDDSTRFRADVTSGIIECVRVVGVGSRCGLRSHTVGRKSIPVYW